MGAKERQHITDASKVEVGEIDTRAPFQSVKDALYMFEEGALSGEKPAIKKPKAHSAERALARETQLHLTQKVLNKLKDQLKNAETTKTEALTELEKAKRTVEDLTKKLNSVTESKEAAVKATEAAKNKAKQIEEANGSNHATKQDFCSSREQYMSIITELDTRKQELWKIRQERDASLEAKLAALDQAAEAEHAAKVNVEKISDLSMEISTLQESVDQVKLASIQAQQEHAKTLSEKDVQRQSYRAALEASAKKLQTLKSEFDPELAHNLQKQLTETMNEIGNLQQQMESTKASDLNAVTIVTSELDGAKESLQKVAEEESSLHDLVESLKLDLENVKTEHYELKEKEAETESLAGNLHVKLRKSKSELEAALAEEARERGASEEMISTLHQLSLEAENARHEAEEMKNKAEELKKEAEATRIAVDEAEKKLRVALEEAEEAETAEAMALEQIKTLSERTNAARASTSESGAKITISRDEYEALSRKVEESDSLAEMKVSAAMAQVEAVKASENEALKRLEAMKKEIEDMRAETEEALKRAEMAEAAKKAVEGELRRWREREQKKAAETAARILAETEMSSESSPRRYSFQKPSESSPHYYSFQKQDPAPMPQRALEVRRLEKGKTVSKKVHMPSISGIFQRRKSQLEVASPSYLPGENPI